MAERVAIREAYGQALVELGKENQEIVVLEADVGSSSKSIYFGQAFADRYFNMGIAEAGMAACAAGMAATGKIPFINTFAAFMVLRAGDAVRSLIAYMDLNVKLAGAYAGLSAAYDGATHHALADLAFMRAMPNMTVISVADAVETKAAVSAAAGHRGPVYLRLSRAELPVLYEPSQFSFELGKGIRLTDGNDVTIVATGYLVAKALEACEGLRSKGIRARVLDIHTIKPLDEPLLIRCAQETGAMVVCEEHSIYGGLGSAVCEVLAKAYPVPVELVGVEDRFTESGDYEQLLCKYGLSAENIERKVKEVMKRKRRMMG